MRPGAARSPRAAGRSRPATGSPPCAGTWTAIACGAALRRRCCNSRRRQVRPQRDVQHRFARRRDGFAQRRRQRVDGAAFEPLPGDDAPRRAPTVRRTTARSASAAGPRSGRGTRRTRRRRSRSWPAAAAQRRCRPCAERRPSRRRSRAAASSRRRAPAPWRRRARSRARPACRTAASPRSSQPIQRWRSLKSHARAVEPPQPGAQQRRGLERLRKHAAARCRRTCPGRAPRTRRARRAGGNASIAARRCGIAAP